MVKTASKMNKNYFREMNDQLRVCRSQLKLKLNLRFLRSDVLKLIINYEKGYFQIN